MDKAKEGVDSLYVFFDNEVNAGKSNMNQYVIQLHLFIVMSSNHSQLSLSYPTVPLKCLILINIIIF